VLLTIKLTVPFLLMLLAIGAARARVLTNWACLSAAVLLVCSLNFRVQIGIRLVLPLVALAIVGLAAACVEACRHGRWQDRRRLLTAGVAAALVWNVVAAALVWPHGLGYVNELWGGHERGYRLISDSNYDWGQGLPELHAWQQRNGGVEVDLWYFGCDPAMAKMHIHSVPFHRLPIQGPSDVLAQTRCRYLAVSTTLLYGLATKAESHESAAAFLRSCTPIDRTTTFLIFDRHSLQQHAAAR
jgi:hypothetical protein